MSDWILDALQYFEPFRAPAQALIDTAAALLQELEGDTIRNVAIAYGVFALVAPWGERYRQQVREFLFVFPFVLFFLVVLAGLFWCWLTYRDVADGHVPSFFPEHPALRDLVTLALWPFATLGLLGVALFILSSIIWAPWVLYHIPGVVFLFAAFWLRLAWVILVHPVKLLLFLWHFLHYLFVPHPAEVAYKRAQGSGMPDSALAVEIADVIYTHDVQALDALPKAWKSRNFKKRLDAFRERVEAEQSFMETLERTLYQRGIHP